MKEPDLDLGDDHTLRFYGWSPERDINPQYDGIPDEPKAGAVVDHLRPDGTPCIGSGVHFDTPIMRQVTKDQNMWQVESWEPLTLSPSLLCRACGDHGFIREGRWVRA